MIRTSIKLFCALISLFSFQSYADKAVVTPAKPRPSVVIIGDSTIDNKVWVFPGVFGNLFLDQLHLAGLFNRAQQRLGNPMSVVQHLQALLPEYEIKDYSNDGFTTTDCLGASESGTGAFRDKVFPALSVGFIHRGFYPHLFPHEQFKPLEAARDDLKHADVIILSIGGNNFREFLVKAHKIDSPQKRATFIKENYDLVFTKMRKEYIEIVNVIRSYNSTAHIILMTQYYPSTAQNFYKIYPFMQQIGQAKNLGGPTHNPLIVIHQIMQDTYQYVFKHIPTDHLNVADITSSLDPSDKSHHVRQIEPSREGGRKIALMLRYLIVNAKGNGEAYRFRAEFFNKARNENIASTDDVIKTPLNTWIPLNPNFTTQ